MQLNNHPLASINPLPAPGWKPPSAEERQKELVGHVEEFASLLFAHMVTEMREASKSGEDEEQEGGGAFGGGDTDNFMHLFDQQVGKTFVTQGGSGLKDALQRQLSSALQAQTEAKGGSQQ